MNTTFTLMLFIDVCLMVAIVVLMSRLIRLPDIVQKTKKLKELEISLQSLIREASASSSVFNDELDKNRIKIEKLLLDLETQNVKLNKTTHQADKIDKSISGLIENASKIINGFHALKIEEGNSDLSKFINVKFNKPERLNFSIFSNIKKKNKVINAACIESNSSDSDNVIIRKVSLDSLVEKVEVKDRKQDASDRMLMFQKAELMLEQGESVESVSKATAMDIEQVSMLAAFIGN